MTGTLSAFPEGEEKTPAGSGTSASMLLDRDDVEEKLAGLKGCRAGFHEYVDSEEMFMSIFQDLRNQHIIP